MTTEKPVKNPLQLLINANPCPKCRLAARTKCECGGGSGGPGGGSGNKDEKQAMNNANTTGDLKAKANDQDIGNFNSMIADGKILFTAENDLNTIKLTFRCKQGLTREELEAVEKFLNYVNMRFGEFLDSLKADGVNIKNFAASLDKNTLVLKINIPGNQHYKEFIDYLMVPALREERERKEVKSEADTNPEFKPFNPSPLRTKPVPKGHNDMNNNS